MFEVSLLQPLREPQAPLLGAQAQALAPAPKARTSRILSALIPVPALTAVPALGEEGTRKLEKVPRSLPCGCLMPSDAAPLPEAEACQGEPGVLNGFLRKV